MFPHQSWLPPLKLPRFQAFGGPLLKGNARSARPFSRRSPLLLVMKSAPQARGRYDLLRYQRHIQRVFSRLARRFRVDVMAFGQRDGRHIHFIVRAPSRKVLSDLLRAFAGLVARRVWCAERGRPAQNLRSLWIQRPYSQILNWSSEIKDWRRYIGRKSESNLSFSDHSLSPTSNSS